jgi:adenylate cyclase
MPAQLKPRVIRIAIIGVAFLVLLANMLGLFDLHMASSILVKDSLLGGWLQSGRTPELLQSPVFGGFVILGVIMTLVLPMLSPIRASLLTLICGLAAFTLSYALPGSERLLPLEFLFLTILLLFVINVLTGYFFETHARQQLMSLFGQYAPPELVAAMGGDPARFTMEGEAREMSVLFADIRGFSEIAEQLDPKELSRMLNMYFTAMTDVLRRHNATIDKYIGDAIMVFWGAPMRQFDHADRAVRAALELKRKAKRLRRAFERQGWPPLSIGISINSGMMNVGNMGSKFRVAYTVIGDAVNLAARLEQLTRHYGVDMIVSESTRNSCPGAVYRELDLVRVKGKVELTRIYEPLCLLEKMDDELSAGLQKHREALQAYYERNWDNAEALFQELRHKSSRVQYYTVMLERVRRFRNHPPPDDWQGETSFNRR